MPDDNENAVSRCLTKTKFPSLNEPLYSDCGVFAYCRSFVMRCSWLLQELFQSVRVRCV